MLLYRGRQVVHVLIDVDKRHRACVTACYQYLDVKPSQVLDSPKDVFATCLECVARVRHVDVPDQAVHERWEDHVHYCKQAGTHLKIVDSDGFCCACGYQDDL